MKRGLNHRILRRLHMNDTKHIPYPQIKDAKVLTPNELNALRFTGKHTLLTPEILSKFASAKQ